MNYLIDKIKQNDLISKKHKIVCIFLNYIEQSIFLVSAVTMCFDFCFFFVSWHSSSAARLKTCIMTSEIKRYKSIIKKNRTKHNK